MAVGYPKNKESIDNWAGRLALSVNSNFRQGVQFKAELDLLTDANLTAMGYTSTEVAQLRTFAADMVQLNNIWTGGLALLVVKNFQANARALWGVPGDM